MTYADIAKQECRLRSAYRGERERPGGVPASAHFSQTPDAVRRVGVTEALQGGPKARSGIAATLHCKPTQLVAVLEGMEADGLITRVRLQRGDEWSLVTK